MKLTPLVLAIRAISAEFARRIYLPVVYIGSAVLLILVVLEAWLVTISTWWWLLLVPIVFVALLFIILAVIARVAITFLRPQQTKEQTQTVRKFVDALQKTSETIQTPKFIILFRLIKDMISPSKQSYVHEISGTASSLRTELSKVLKAF